jgi:hypothetical protein
MKILICTLLLTITFSFPFKTAQAVGDASCETGMSDAWTAYGNIFNSYTNQYAGYFNQQVLFLNDVLLSDPENVLCHFRLSMGIDPITIGTHSKDFGGMTVNVVVETPTESWATGYTYKGSVYVGAVEAGNFYMAIWWGGSLTSSKGYMVTGANNMDGGNDVMLNYIEWDRTVATNQYIKAYLAHFDNTTGYLNSAADSSSGSWGDMATYGSITYNSTTKAVTVQNISIENQRTDPYGSSDGSSGSFGCFRMIASGTKDGTIYLAHTADANMGSGDAVTNAVTTTSGMKAVSLTDSTTFADGDETNIADPVNDANTSSLAFDITCNGLNSAAGSGNVFDGNDTDATKSPSTIFP